jgi:hypothetical protein
MADSPSPRSPQTSASQSTRQLLDELDTLMQRMLAVPVQTADIEPAEAPAEAPAVPAPRQVGLVPAPIAAPAVHTQAPVELSAPLAQPLMPIILQRPKGKVAEKPALLHAPAPPKAMPQLALAPAPDPKPAWMSPTADKLPAAAAVPSVMSRWLIALNRSYDRGTDWLGPLGRWLRSEQGRSLLGWTGLGMLAVALVWAAVRFLG